MNQSTKIVAVFLALVALGMSFIGYALWDLTRPLPATVSILDIGQGDAILIQTAARRTILIDGGPDNTVIYRLSAHLPYYQRTLDLLVLTHPDNDHVAGLPEVLRRYDVGAVLLTGITHSNAAYQTLLQELTQRHIPVIVAGTVAVIQIDDRAALQIFYPTQSIVSQTFKKINDSSIVSRLIIGDLSILLTGDTTKKIEADLLSSGVSLEATVLKVAHHGSDTSSAEAFLRAVSPELAVISSGRENRFGHPNPNVLQRLSNVAIPVLDTQRVGDITLYFEPAGVRVETGGITELEK